MEPGWPGDTQLDQSYSIHWNTAPRQQRGRLGWAAGKVRLLAGQSVNTSILEDLGKNSKFFEQLSSDFTSILRETRFYTRCFYESAGITSLKLVGRRVVNDTSTSIDDPVVSKNFPLPGTHSQICKYANSTDVGYDRISKAIRYFVGNITPRYVLATSSKLDPVPALLSGY